jgi:ketosteroid isomerase-like protein
MASKSDDMAYLQGTYTMIDPKNKKPMTDKGKYLTVFTKQPDGSWKAIADAFNSDPPM